MDSGKKIIIFLLVCSLLVEAKCMAELKALREVQKDSLQLLCEVNSELFNQEIKTAENLNLRLPEDIKSTYLGEFEITHYDAECIKCCGKTDGITASGKKARPHQTVAVDTEVIPLGSLLNINGQIYIAEDRGGAIKGNRIDICVCSHEEALNLGRYTAGVYLLEGKENEI